MMIPSIKQMFLFFTLNFLLIAFFNILLFKKIGFITYVRFYDILTINILKIAMLVSVYILTCFILNLLFFALLFKNDFKRTLFKYSQNEYGDIFSRNYICSGNYISKGILKNNRL